MDNNIDYSKFKVIVHGDNEDGSKLFARFTYKKKALVKGYYSFNKEKFFITSYVKQNLLNCGIDTNTAKEIMSKILMMDYDWELYEGI